MKFSSLLKNASQQLPGLTGNLLIALRAVPDEVRAPIFPGLMVVPGDQHVTSWVGSASAAEVRDHIRSAVQRTTWQELVSRGFYFLTQEYLSLPPLPSPEPLIVPGPVSTIKVSYDSQRHGPAVKEFTLSAVLTAADVVLSLCGGSAGDYELLSTDRNHVVVGPLQSHFATLTSTPTLHLHRIEDEDRPLILPPRKKICL